MSQVRPTLRVILRRASRPSRAAVLAATIVILFFLSVGSSDLSGALRHWHVLPQGQTFSTAYFTQPSNLPKHYTPSKRQYMTVTLENHEGISTAYRYTVTQFDVQNSPLVTLADGTVSLRAAEHKSVIIPFYPIDGGSRSKMALSITSGGEHLSLSYWANRSAE
ncbi:MAG TPA: hypothetical protein VF466_01275 [Candidatus Saccharimonadales bacterium]